MTSSEGAGGLETLRFDAVFAAEATPGSSLVFRDESFDGRLGWREIVVRAEDGARIVSSSAPTESVERRAPRVSVRPPQLAARRPRGSGRVRARVVGGPAPSLEDGSGARARGGEVRVARLAGGPRRRRRARLAARGDVLGRGARAHPGPREGDRRRLPRRIARHPAPRGLPRADRHRDAHRRRLRARPRHAPALPLHRAGAALPMADRRLGPARRRRRPRGARRARPPRPGARSRARRITTTITTTTTTTATAAAGSWASASPPACSRARRPWSCCSERSRSTGWGSASR